MKNITPFLLVFHKQIALSIHRQIERREICMNDLEAYIKTLILSEYSSLKQFSETIEMPWSTLDSILKRGIANSNTSNVLKITQELGLDIENLMNGDFSESVFLTPITFPKKEKTSNNTTCQKKSDIDSSLLHSEELELISHYRELSLKDKRWIMGQIVDLLKKEEEDKQFTTKSPKVQ